MNDYNLRMKTPAKINFYLEIQDRRKDGFHNIVTVMQTISLFDELYFTTTPDEIKVECDPQQPFSQEDNIVYKAAHLLKKHTAVNRGVKITLKKGIPIGSGLGGGSSDAACTLKALSKLWGLKLNREDLFKYAVLLGCDVPFFLDGGLSVGKGRGEKLSPLLRGAKPRLNPVLVCPDIEAPTGDIYSAWDKQGYSTRAPGLDGFMKALYSYDVSDLACHFYNDFESLVIKRHPVIGEIKNELKRLGALNAVMTGSGSAVFGIFPNREKADAAFNSLKEKERYGKVFNVNTI